METKIEEISPFLEAVGDRFLTPEWLALAPSIDHFSRQYPESKVAGETTADFAVFSSERVMRFDEFEDAPRGKGKITPSFKNHLLNRVESYLDLTGLHGVEGREDAFKGLEKDLKRYVLGHEQSIYGDEYGGGAPRFSPWYKRLWANVCEELGLHTEDMALIRKSLILNESLVYDRSIADNEPFKVRANFSKFDVADELFDDKRKLKQLELPTSYEALQREFYDRLFYTTKQLTEYSENELADCVGAISELLLIGRLRDVHLNSGEYRRLGVRQGFIHQDNGSTHRKERESDEKLVNDSVVSINTSFDLIVFERNTSNRVNIDAKKGMNGGKTGLSPNIINIKFNHKDLSAKDLVKKAHKIARIRKRQLQGKTVNRDDIEFLETFFANIDFNRSLRRYNARVGRAVIEMADNS